jgi:hypothetical protein
MKRIYCLLLFVVSISPALYAQREKENIEMSISKFFDGFSELAINKLKEYSTADFILLENGEVWNLDTLISKISGRKNSNVRRVNKFEFIKTEQNRKVAWVSYHNTAEFTVNEKQQTVKWLESAVLVKEKGIWKIKLLHSTRLK